MVQKNNGLTPLQIETLTWIKAGQPPEVIAADTDLRYRGHARRLERLGLVEISGSGDSWQVQLTELGLKWPNIPAVVDPVPARPRRQAQPPRPVKTLLPPAPPAVGTKELFEELRAAEFHVLSRRVYEDTDTKEWKKQAAALQSAKLLLGEEYRVSTQTRREGPYFSSREFFEIGIFPVDRWLSDPPPEEIKRYHPAVAKVMKYSTNVSAALKLRARRLLHSLFCEITARGWTHGPLEVGPYSGHRNSHERGSLKVRDTGYGFFDGQRGYFVSVSEQVDIVEREPTKKEIAAHEDQLRWYPDAKIKKFYDHPYNGKLTVTIGSYQVKDTKTRTAEASLPVVFSAMAVAQEWAAYGSEMQSRADARWAKKIAIAEKQAEKIFRNHEFYDALEVRSLEWSKFQKIREYVKDLRSHVESLPAGDSAEAGEWLEWCEKHLDDRNPMYSIQVPEVSKVRGYERDNLINRLALQIKDAEVGE